MSTFLDLIAPDTLASARDKVKGFCVGAGLKITNWATGGVGQQMFESVSQTAYAFGAIVTRITRGFAGLDYSTDPGDPDTYDPSNEALPAASGFLSNFGANTFGTTREGATFATGFVDFDNAGAVARTFAPYALTFTWTANSPPSPPPTYRNAPDSSIYTNADGTVTVGAGATLTIPVVADELGTGSSCPASSLSLTTSLLGCTATNVEAVIGTDRESADTYRERCREAPARISLGGPDAAYAYLAAKNLDGSVLLNAGSPPAPVGITRVYVSQDSSTGIVTVYYASATGAAIADDVTAANANIQAQSFAVPDAITFSGSAASTVAIHVQGTAKIKNKPGITAALVVAAMVQALENYFATIPIGGFDQTAGAGFVYTVDIQAAAAAGYAGLYDVIVTLPAGASTSLALGQVATLTCSVTPAIDWTVTLV